MKSKIAVILTAGVILACAQPLVISRYDNQQYRFTATDLQSVDSGVFRQISPYRDSLAMSMKKVLGHTTVPLVKIELSNFVADACFKELKERQVAFDFIVFNRGGLRRALPGGDVTEGDMYELMPFENTLVVAQLDGPTTLELCHWIGKRGYDPIAGIVMKYDQERGAHDIFIDGAPLDTNRSYWVATNNFAVNGGDNFEMFLKRTGFVDTGIPVRDALMDYVVKFDAKGAKIEADYQQRVQKEQR